MGTKRKRRLASHRVVRGGRNQDFLNFHPSRQSSMQESNSLGREQDRILEEEEGGRLQKWSVGVDDDFGTEMDVFEEEGVGREEGKISLIAGEAQSSGEREELSEQIDSDDEDHPCGSDVDEKENGEGDGGGLALDWRQVAGILMSTGTYKFRRPQYNMFNSFMAWEMRQGTWKRASSTRLPSSSTMNRKVMPIADRVAFASHEVVQFEVDLSKSGARGGVDAHRSTTHAPVSIVHLSTWAKRDMSYSVMHDLVRGRHPSVMGRPNVFTTIEDIPLVQHREHVLSSFKLSDESGNLAPVAAGSKIAFFLHGNEEYATLLNEAGLISAGIPKRRGIAVSGTVEEVRITRQSPNLRVVQDEQGNVVRKSNVHEYVLRPGDILIRMRTTGMKAYLVYRMVRSLFSHDESRISFITPREELSPHVAIVATITERRNIRKHARVNSSPLWRYCEGSQSMCTPGRKVGGWKRVRCLPMLPVL